MRFALSSAEHRASLACAGAQICASAELLQRAVRKHPRPSVTTERGHGVRIG